MADLRTAASGAELSGETDTLVRALTGIAVVHHYRGELTRADGHFTRVLRLAEDFGDREVLSRAVANVGASAWWLGDWPLALRRYNESLALVVGGGSPVLEAMALINRATVMNACGQYSRAGVELRRAVQLGHDSDNLDVVRNAVSQLAEADIHLGRPQLGVAALSPLLDRPGQREWQFTDFLSILAEAHLAAGSVGSARVVAEQAVDRARTVEHALALVEALRVLGLAAVAEKEWAVASACLDEALEMACAMNAPYPQARVRAALASLAAGEGAAERASRERDVSASLMASLRCPRVVHRVVHCRG